MQAVILAGGYGKRLRTVVSDRPKPMAIMNGKPFLEYQIMFLRNQGIKNIVMCVGYKHEKIIEYFKNGTNHFTQIIYSIENHPLGTGGAIKHAQDLLDENFFLLNGDTITNVNLDLLVEFHNKKDADVTMLLVNLDDKSRYGNVIIDDDSRIVFFSEKNNDTSNSLVNAGIYLIKKNSIDWSSFPDNFSMEKDLFPQIIKSKNVFGFIFRGYFMDIGTPQDYSRFESDIRNGDWVI